MDYIDNEIELKENCSPSNKSSFQNIDKKIAVIGAGCCGLICVAMLKEEGLDPVCYEKTDRPGGTWCYRENPEAGVGSTMPTTIINHSKEMGSISTFPAAKEYNNYMKHTEAYSYCMEYFSKNDCLRHVLFNHETIKVERSPDYDITGRWFVTVKNKNKGEVFTSVFDGVMVCVGHLNHPKMPSFPGQERFEGRIMHTHSLKNVSEFNGKNVLVVGMGCSALDAAVEISNIAKQVFLSTKTGAYVATRIGPKGYPTDYMFFRRYKALLLNYFSRKRVSMWLEKTFIDRIFHHSLYNVTPKYHILEKDPIINDYIFSKLLSGSVIQKPDIVQFTENGVLFKGDYEVTEIDAVIMATGYTWKFPFLEENIIVQDDDKINLYKCMYPSQLKHATLAFMGFVLVFGPGTSIAEIQARWATQVFVGKKSLPSKKIMDEDINRRYEINKKSYAPNDKISIRVDYVQYMDEIADQIEVKPNLFKLFLTDYELFKKLLFGPSLPYQYRLFGVNKWDGAREAIMNSEKRVMYPLTKTKHKVESENLNFGHNTKNVQFTNDNFTQKVAKAFLNCTIL